MTSALAPRVWLAFVAVSVCACSFDADANGARGCDERCAPDKCYLDFCLQTLDEAQGGIQGIPGAGAGGLAGAESGTGPGPAGTGGEGGAGSAGNSVPPGCVPAAETCNSADDDCDGQSDEALVLGSCQATGSGACTSGVLRCQNGLEVCAVAAEPAAELCNTLDDDCDGTVDEDADVPCYPDGTAGCEPLSAGGYECAGLCAAGVSVCKDGTPGACSGFVAPAAKEVCGVAGAADDNCNGEVDDGCPCAANQTQTCYPGPARTAGRGRCHEGEQHCVNGLFGPCEGAVTPGTERCANEGEDDDCNGTEDDVFGLGLWCFESGNLGLCRLGTLECSDGEAICETVPAAPTEAYCDGLDEDCDGSYDETFAFATDEDNCGACAVACASAQTCCAAGCRDTRSDAQHCGGCGRACSAGQTCCGGQCVSTDTVAHCGACGRACSAGQACCGGECVAANTVAHCGGCSPCANGQACCGGECVATNTVNHCGGCERCADGLACCGGECVALDTVAHCGGCSPCEGGQACCDSQCVDTGTVTHCGGCGGCAGANDVCCKGQCVPRLGEQDDCTPRCADVCAAPCTCVGEDCVDSGGLFCL